MTDLEYKSEYKDDDELQAAALAGVYAYISNSNQSLKQKNETKGESKSLRYKTSLLENISHNYLCHSLTSKLSISKKTKSLWRIVSFSIVFIYICTASICHAFATTDDQIESETESIANQKFLNNQIITVLNNEELQNIKTVRVGLQIGITSSQISSTNGAILRDKSTGEIIARLPEGNTWRVATNNNKNPWQISLLESSISQSPYTMVGYLPLQNRFDSTTNHTIPELISKFLLAANDKVYMIEPENPESFVSVNNKPYRGCLLIYPNFTKNNFSIINVADLEDYLKSVVPSEMPSSWPKESLKAQSIAARSYALANLGKHNSEGYDVKPTTEDQVYSGIASEAQTTNIAIDETKGIVAKHNGKVITAYFHSTSGGITELAENVWNSAVPFLKSVLDIDTSSPYINWKRAYNAAELEERLKKSNKNIGYLVNLLPIAFAPSGRTSYLLVSGSQSTLLLTGEELRHILNLPSTLFKLECTQDGYSFVGRGFGHGLGLSQWGAKALAEQGYNAEEILSYYYKDITVEKY
jgi:stage II sporulation protein D